MHRVEAAGLLAGEKLTTRIGHDDIAMIVMIVEKTICIGRPLLLHISNRYVSGV